MESTGNSLKMEGLKLTAIKGQYQIHPNAEMEGKSLSTVENRLK
ncbi:hypothetical protein MED297_05724 [Reinekea sp. MED297]|uniref:Uncharacterized protein n=1 Tax=Reinekea blandensis MED297 TaxID=314283 RepID=A4BD79_9GAMM|nr:hypothetical protein MED297_05724 [Reinekea sp. MED297] [Reinekea blandensis MED297]